MKTKLCYLLLSALFFISCKKEYSVENGAGTTATFTYDGAPNNCLVPAVQGSYLTGTALDASNTVSLAVNVTKLGTYSVSTNSINGITFSGTGTFTVLGSQNIDLTGTGTPVAQGPYAFKATANGCTFTVDVIGAGPAAVYTYTSTTGDCTGPAVAGAYASGTVLGATNTVDLKVNVTTAGTYTVTTNTANGVSFSGSGTLSAGTQTIRLLGTGTPAAAGTFNFTPTNNGCAFPVIFTAPLPPAKFTFAGSPATCTAPVISGTYIAGTALTAANSIKLTVTVTVAGAYSLTTNSSNGVTFSGTGNLALGVQTVTLTSTNKPTVATIATYTPVDNNTATNIGCSFDISYDPSTSTGATGIYKATVGTVTYDFATNNLDGNYLGANTLALYGEGSATTTDPNFEIIFDNDPSSLIIGSYKNLTGTNAVQTCYITYSDPSGTIWSSSPINNNTFTTDVTAVTANTVVGTFSGTLYNNSGAGPNSVTVTAGLFNVKW
jgi:hypothetical protein